MKRILLCSVIIIIMFAGFQAFGMDYVTLNDSHRMPVLGLGTWTLDDSQAEEAVYTAIMEGYRLIDTARYYGNESGVGQGIRRAIREGLVTREEVFITSKILPGGNPASEIEASNKALGLGYVDLMLIHQPGYHDERAYQALEQAVKSGIVKSIGISNYYTTDEFERMNRIASITPAVVQNENHIYYQNTELQEYLTRYGVKIESWYPLGGRGHKRELLNDSAITKMALAHGRTTAQIIIRWHIQAGYIVIPGSGSPEHIRENIDVFDFALTDDEMKTIAALNKARRFENC